MKSGSVPRSLFGDAPADTENGLDNFIRNVLDQKAFGFAVMTDIHALATDQLFLVQPLENFDKAGTLSLLRTSASISFLSTYIASRFALALEKRVDQGREPAVPSVQQQPRTLVSRPQIDARETFGVVVPVIDEHLLVGEADTFVLESHARERRPLYLRPHSPNLAAIDSILVTPSVAFLIQSAVAGHEHSVPVLLRIAARLQAVHIEVDSLELELVYCLVGIDEGCVRTLVAAASKKAPRAVKVPKGLAALSTAVRARLNRLKVHGVIFDMENRKLALVK
ncbi:hypothetical protein FB451DRAFT_1202111 [Mycena latifolia]|nr:hypothetical protein FB451DRAFT_1202111 [Mycena latifolia]